MEFRWFDKTFFNLNETPKLAESSAGMNAQVY